MNPIDRHNPIPIQHQLYSALKEWFISDFSVEDTLPTEIVIAEKFKVSRGTVRIAMDNLVKEGLISRVSGRGSFLTKKFYINLRNYRIGVILSDIDFFTNSIWEYTWSSHLEIINGIIRSSLDFNISPELMSEKQLCMEDNELFDGFIVWPYVHKDVLDKLKKPHILLNYDIDMESGFLSLTRDIVKNRFNNIAFIGFTSGNRIETINRTLKENECTPIPAGNIFQCGGNPKEAYRSCSQLFKNNPDVDCIICSTDLRAQGVIEYLLELEIQIPAQVSIYGFDGTRKNSQIVPSITSCSFEWTYPGAFSIKKIRAILDEKPAPVYQPPKGQFLKRESSP